MNKDAYRRAAEVLRPGAQVAFLGQGSRTWYQDIGVINEIVWWILEEQAEIRVAGKLPFDALVEAAAMEAGTDITCTGPRDLDSRIKLKAREAYVIDGADLVVAFPAEGKDVTTADPLVELALMDGIPVLAVYRTKAIWYTAENYGF